MKRQEILRRLKELERNAKNSEPFGLTFSPVRGTEADRKRLEDHLRSRFHSWQLTWILPKIAAIRKLVEDGKR